jgi:nitrogen fixation/metabolism regulation signal transduction histidine kinase
MQDYKVITKRLMFIAEQLIDLSLEQIAQSAEHYYSNSWRSRYHELSGTLNRLKEKYADNSDIISDIATISKMVNNWATKDQNPKIIKLDLFTEIKGIIDTSITLREFKNRITIQSNTNSDPNIFITFNIEFLRTLISSIVENVREEGINSKKNWIIKIEFTIDNDYVYLLVTDNVGNYNKFLSIIDSINNFRPPENTKGEHRGNGLILIKKLIRDIGKHKEKWKLTQNNEYKTLWIPLAKKENY